MLDSCMINNILLVVEGEDKGNFEIGELEFVDMQDYFPRPGAYLE